MTQIDKSINDLKDCVSVNGVYRYPNVNVVKDVLLEIERLRDNEKVLVGALEIGLRCAKYLAATVEKDNIPLQGNIDTMNKALAQVKRK